MGLDPKWIRVTRKSFLLIFCVFVVELAKAVFVLFLPSQPHSNFLAFCFYGLQIVSSPIQGDFSDRYCRKRSLLFALICILSSQFLLIFYLYQSDFVGSFFILLGAILLYGALGNADVISRAGIVDIFFVKGNTGKSIKMAISLTFFVLPIAWLLVANFKLFISDAFLVYILIAALLISLFMVYLFFEDKRDYDREAKVKSLYQFIRAEHFGLGFFGLLCAEIGYQLSYLYQDDITPRRLENFYTIGFAGGMLLGVVIQAISIGKDRKFVLSGIKHSAIATALVIFALLLKVDRKIIAFIIYFYFAIGSGLYLPRFFILYSKGHKPHEQGKLFGLLDSILTLGEVTATILLFAKFREVSYFIIAIILFLNALIILNWKLKKIEGLIKS